MRDIGRAFFVLGPESSGTRLATEILINAGCHGSSDHIQPLDDLQFNLKSIPISTPVVWRRSFPHNNEIPKLADMLRRVRPREGIAIVTVRDWYCIQQSQLRDHQHAKSIEQADRNISQAYEIIFHKIRMCGIGYRTFVYESVVAESGAQVRFVESLGLQLPGNLIEVYDGDRKYFEQGERGNSDVMRQSYGTQ